MFSSLNLSLTLLLRSHLCELKLVCDHLLKLLLSPHLDALHRSLLFHRRRRLLLLTTFRHLNTDGVVGVSAAPQHLGNQLKNEILD